MQAKKTLVAVEKALATGHKALSAVTLENADPLPADAGKMAAPAKDAIHLLHWYDDIKPRIRNDARLLVYEPVSGLSWTVVVHSRGRHCDVEPRTLKDTQIMLKAFGNKNTWSQKGVYVKLPDGQWTVGSTHSVPHLSGYVTDNGFEGHTCIHFLRDMAECEEQDPDYGVRNQRTIRSLWKKLTGETVN